MVFGTKAGIKNITQFLKIGNFLFLGNRTIKFSQKITTIRSPENKGYGPSHLVFVASIGASAKPRRVESAISKKGYSAFQPLVGPAFFESSRESRRAFAPVEICIFGPLQCFTPANEGRADSATNPVFSQYPSIPPRASQ